MTENPDRQTAERGNLAPSQGDLRFVLRSGDSALYEQKGKTLRILQRWEWSYTEARFNWYDVQLVEDADEEEAG